jgi:type IV pilus assembly protein PilN
MILLASIKSLETDTKESEARLAALTKVIGEIENIKDEKRVLEKKLGVIGGLEKDRTYPVRMLDDVSSQVPTKDIWLDKISEAGGQLTLEGKARDNFAVVRFMKNLEGSMYVRSVELISSRQVDISGIKLQQFALSCGLRKDL